MNFRQNVFQKSTLIPIVALLLVLTNGSLHAADTPLNVIPENVTALVRLKSSKDVADKAAAIAELARPGIGDLVKGQAQSLGIAIANPSLDGVDQKGEFFVAIFAHADAEPDVVLIVPATDVEDMEDAIDESYDFMAYKSWGIYTQDKDVLKKFKACLGGTGKAIKKIPDGKPNEIFNKGDLTAWVNILQLKIIYKEEIKEVLEEAKEGLEEAQDEIENAEDEPGMEMINREELSKLLPVFFVHALQSFHDAKSFTLSVGLNRTDISIVEHFEVKAESQTAKLMQELPPTTSTVLNRLPKNELVYGELSASVMNKYMTFAERVIKIIKLDDEQKKAVNDGIAKMKKVKFGSLGQSSQIGTADETPEGILAFTTLIDATPIDAVKEASRELVPKMGVIDTPGVYQEMEFKKDAETYGDLKADLTRVTQEFDQDGPAGEMQEKMIELFYGSNGIESRIVYLKGALLQSTSGGKKRMVDSLAAFKSADGLSESAPLTKDRKSLPEKTNLVVLVDLPNTVAKIVSAVIDSGSLPIPIDASPLADLKLERSYAGWSVTTDKQGCSSQVHIPHTTIKNFGEIVQAFIDMQQNPEF